MLPASSTSFEEWARGLTKRGVLGYLDISLPAVGPDRRRQACGAAGSEARRHADRGFADPLCHHRDRARNRPRDLADARAAGRCACAPPMRCPGFSRRLRIGGRWLVDGALVNPVPVSAARALGARLVIARQSQRRHSRPRHDHCQRGADEASRKVAAPSGAVCAQFSDPSIRSSASSSARRAGRASRP